LCKKSPELFLLFYFQLVWLDPAVRFIFVPIYNLTAGFAGEEGVRKAMYTQGDCNRSKAGEAGDRPIDTGQGS
jgi:hypothetical protein